MTTARATRGSTGQKLMSGFDIHGGGIQIDKTCSYSNLQDAIAPPAEWIELLLVNLINSNNTKINQLAKHLEHEGYDLFRPCRFNKSSNNIYFVRIDNKEFRIKNNKILKMK